MYKKRRSKNFSAVTLVLALIFLVSMVSFLFLWLSAESKLKKADDVSAKLAATEKKLSDTQKKLEETEKERNQIKSELESTSFKIKTLQSKIEQLEKDKAAAVDEAAKLQAENDRLSILNGLSENKLKLVALTFDDGPSKYTPRLLDLLKSKNMKATFFVLGSQVEKFPDIAKRTVSEGHEIANHSYIHKLLNKITPAEAREEMTRGANAIEKATGIKVSLMRPPGGNFTPEVKKLCVELGWKNITWHVDTQDWLVRNAQKAYDNAFKGSYTVRDGSIVLMHDIKDVYVDGAELIMNQLEKEKYITVTVSQLLALRADGGVPGETYRLLEPKK